jgi:hypothetical protein
MLLYLNVPIVVTGTVVYGTAAWMLWSNHSGSRAMWSAIREHERTGKPVPGWKGWRHGEAPDCAEIRRRKARLTCPEGAGARGPDYAWPVEPGSWRWALEQGGLADIDEITSYTLQCWSRGVDPAPGLFDRVGPFAAAERDRAEQAVRDIAGAIVAAELARVAAQDAAMDAADARAGRESRGDRPVVLVDVEEYPDGDPWHPRCPGSVPVDAGGDSVLTRCACRTGHEGQCQGSPALSASGGDHRDA